MASGARTQFVRVVCLASLWPGALLLTIAESAHAAGPIAEPPMPTIEPPMATIEPPIPTATPFEERRFFMVGFQYGFAGNFHRDLDDDTAIPRTLGGTLRLDIPVDRYLVIGPLVQFATWKPPLRHRHHDVDLDFHLRGRIPVSGPSSNLQFWGGVPLGLTIDLVGKGADHVGWNTGVVLGGAVHFMPAFGLFAELGWLRRMDFESFNANFSTWSFNMGFAFRD